MSTLNIDVSPAVHRLVSAGLLLVLIFSLWGAVFKPLWHLTTQALNQLYDAKFELARAKLLSDELVHLSNQDIEQQISELTPLLLWTDANTNQESAIQDIVDQLVKSSGCNLESMRISDTKQQGSITRVTLDLRGNGEETAVTKLLTELENHKPLVMIDQLNLRVLDAGMQSGQNAQATKVEVEIKLSGFGSDLTGTAGGLP